MKILYINSTHSDYLQDIIYSGLVKCLGGENVKVLPFNNDYFFNLKKYPKNLGYNKSNLLSQLSIQLRRFKYDYVFVASAKKDAFQSYLKTIEFIPKSCPIIFIDGGDLEEIGGDLKRKECFDLFEKAVSFRKFDLIFKREMLLNKSYNANIFPCPFAFNLDRVSKIKIDKKKYDVSFWAVESHKIRTHALKIMENKYDCKKNGTTLNQTFKKYKRKGDFYLAELKSCKIVLNFRGGGWDTLRYWEVPALSTFLISQKPQIQIPNGFIDNEHLVYCKDDLSDLEYKIDEYLNNHELREKIARNGYKHLTLFHSDIKRTEYVLDIIKKNT